MKETPFVGRVTELRSLELLLKKKSASLVVIQGRRRIGKSRLVEEFGKNRHFYHFSGLPPQIGTSAQSQRDEFTRQLSVATGLPEIQADDWSKLFLLLAKELKEGERVILFDEISWMGSKDPDFLGKLKNAWDLHFKKNPQLILILCGSISSWIEENILAHTGFMGRISLTLFIRELLLNDCMQLLKKSGHQFSSYEAFKILSVTGGIPRYIEEIQPGLSAEENIKNLCFTDRGILFREFNDIFSDLFNKRSELYKKIIEILIEGSCEFDDISKKLSFSKSGRLSSYLDELRKAGFLTRDYTWHLKTGIISRLSHYRLSDNYLRFYLKYIEKNKIKIEQSIFENSSISSLPAWDSIMSLQFENLVLNNRKKIWEHLRIHPEEIISDNPFFQRKTSINPGCQIDYLIHTKFNVLYFCEIKFSKNTISTEIIQEVQQKINRLVKPKGMACKPVLIHVNGVRDSVIESDFFMSIIDFSEFLENNSDS